MGIYQILKPYHERSGLSDPGWSQPPILASGERLAGVRDTRPTDATKAFWMQRLSTQPKSISYLILAIMPLRMPDNRYFTGRWRVQRPTLR